MHEGLPTLPGASIVLISRQLLSAGGVLPVRAADRPPPDPDVRAVVAGGDAVVVQFLARSGRHPGPRDAARHLHAHARHHVHRTQVRHPASGLRQGTLANLRRVTMRLRPHEKNQNPTKRGSKFDRHLIAFRSKNGRQTV